MPPPPANRSLGRGTEKAGRPTVTDLIKAREAEADLRTSEAALRKKLAEERKRFEDFRRDETLRVIQIVAEKELELSQHVANINASTQPDSDHKSLPGLLTTHDFLRHKIVRLIRQIVETGTTPEDSTSHSG